MSVMNDTHSIDPGTTLPRDKEQSVAEFLILGANLVPKHPEMP